MIDYYETKTHPITKRMVLDAYKKVRSNGGAAGIDGQSLEDFANRLPENLYKIWNRMTSGSYHPSVVRQVEIPKKSGGKRSLGIPTVVDRIAQQVVKSYLEPKVEGSFHEDSYGYRPNKTAHQALDMAKKRVAYYEWVVDLDIKGFFDNINHDLMLKAVRYYSQDKWILMYIERWLKVGVMNGGVRSIQEKGTAQGGVISPLLANMFLHFVFDKWMEKHYPRVPFERYSDDVIIHCSSKKQAMFIKSEIARRMNECKLELNESKTQIVYCKNEVHRACNEEKASFDFLGHTFRPRNCLTKRGFKLLFTPCMSSKAKKAVREKVRAIRMNQIVAPIQRVAEILNPKVRGWMNFYCKNNKWTTVDLWRWINLRITVWIMKVRKFSKKRATRWLKQVFGKHPGLFEHWKLVRP